MRRGQRVPPALVVLALVGAAALVVWLAREPDDLARGRDRARHDHAHVRAPRVDLAPEAASPASIVEAIERARVDERAGAAPAASESAREPAREPTTRDDVDPPPALRGVRGLVRDARTKAPIAGAWVTWRVPSPDVCARVFAIDAATLAGQAGLVTDAEGRFEVERLPDDEEPTSTLTAVARGYAPTSTRPGLRDEVVLELGSSGSLEIVADTPIDDLVLEALGHAERPRVRVEREWAPVGREPARVRGTPPRRWSVAFLAPGPWRALVQGREVAAVDVVAGRTTRLVLSLPPVVGVEGTLLGGEAPGFVAFTPVDGDRSTPVVWVECSSGGRFSASLWPGLYAVTFGAHAEGTERRVRELIEVVPGMGPLTLQAPSAGERLEVLLRRDGQPETSDGLGLVSLDLPEDDPFGGDLVHLASTDEPGVHAASAPAGLYALFDGGDLLASSVVLPTGGRLVVERSPAVCRLRFALPVELRPDEALRARVVAVPEVLARRPALRARFATQGHVDVRASHAAPSVELAVGQPGRYLLVGESDLGPLEVWADLTAGGEVLVPLTAR